MKYPSRAFEDVGAIDLDNDQDIGACMEEVIAINEEGNFEELHWTSLHWSSRLYHLHSSTLFFIHTKQS